VRMPELRVLALVLLWAAPICQAILLWLQARAFAKYGHRSFGVLLAGTLLGMVLSIVTLLLYTVPAALHSLKNLYPLALIAGIAQIPIAIWGVAWLFQSYGELHARAASVLPDKSLERTREG
jgi:hypothetical protein